MFQKDVTERYDLTDATLEIVIMLLVAFILGYLLRYFIDQRFRKAYMKKADDIKMGLEADLNKSRKELSDCIADNEKQRKELVFLHTGEINALKVKLETAQSELQGIKTDLENCMAAKVDNTPIELFSISGEETATTDDLKIVEGIGPVIEKILHDGGIKTFADLTNASQEKLQELLDNAGSRFNIHDSSTWPQQASLALNGKWEELKQWQDELNGGKVV